MDQPECSDDELIIFNDFGQPVCHCASDTYPLEDPSLVQDLPLKKRCFKIGDKEPCPTDQALVLSDDDSSSGLLKCGVNLVPFTIFNPSRNATNKCRRGQIYIFDQCRPG